MEGKENFEHVLERFQQADLDKKIEIYTTVQDLSVEQYRELLKFFPIKHLAELEKAMG